MSFGVRTGVRWFVGMAMGGAIALGTNCAFCTLCSSEAIAQITPDRTLPNNSTVTRDAQTFNINGGTQAGRNLFHSFQEFSVPTGFTASFNNAADIQNIFSRVTGGSVSNIDGLIKANPTANLFLINPNGIIFGKNARLNIGGSFLASTASSLKFADGTEFSAKSPQSAPLLTISVPIGLQFEPAAGEIHVQGSGASREVMPDVNRLLNREAGLQVKPDQTLALIGGNVALEGGILTTDGGRIELGSVTGVGLVSLTPIFKGFSLSYGGVQNFGNIQLLKQAAVDASGEGGGDIQLTGKVITLTDGSQIHTTTFGSKPGGTLVVNAQELVKVTGISLDGMFPSRLGTETDTNATGTAGNLTINTHQLLVENGAFFSAGTFGKGQAGHLTINAESVQVSGKSANGRYASGLSSQAFPDSSGNAGNLMINTHQLLIQGGAFVSAGTFGKGNGGSLNVKADSVRVIGKSANDSASGLSTQAESKSSGNAGNLTINTRELLIQDGGYVSASTKNVGTGGNLTVNAAESVQVTGNDSSLSSQAFPDSSGNAGNLMINTHHLLIQGKAFVSAGTYGTGNGGSLNVKADSVQVIGKSADGLSGGGLSTKAESSSSGNAGNLTINTRELLIQDGGYVSASTKNVGNAGNLTVNAAESVKVIGKSADNSDASSLSSQAESSSLGNAGNLMINTHQLLIQGGAFVGTGTFGTTGNGGSLTVNAGSIKVIGTSADGRSASGLSTQPQSGSIGVGGNLTINTRELLLQYGGFVSSGTYSAGKGGDLTVNATDSVRVIGTSADRMKQSSLLAEAKPDSSGTAGNLTIHTGELLVSDGAGVFVRSLGKGNAGNLTVNARSIRLDNNATLNAETQSINTDTNKQQATITLVGVKDLILRRGSNIIANAQGENVIGGNINIDTDILAAVENSYIRANSTDFRGGKVLINAKGIFLSPNSTITAFGANPQLNGIVKTNTPGIDPTRGLVQLPTNLVDASSQIDTSCNPGSKQRASSFTITGRGGLPPNPRAEPLTSDAVQVDWVTLKPSTRNHNSLTVTKKPTPTPEPIVQATGWTRNAKGEVVLTVDASTVTPHSPGFNPASCHASRNH